MSVKDENLEPAQMTSKRRIVSIFIITIVLLVCSAGMCIAPLHISIPGYPGADPDGKVRRYCHGIYHGVNSCTSATTFSTLDSPEKVRNYFNDAGLLYYNGWVDEEVEHWEFIDSDVTTSRMIGPIYFFTRTTIIIDYVPEKREGTTIIQVVDIAIGIPDDEFFRDY